MRRFCRILRLWQDRRGSAAGLEWMTGKPIIQYCVWNWTYISIQPVSYRSFFPRAQTNNPWQVVSMTSCLFSTFVRSYTTTQTFLTVSRTSQYPDQPLGKTTKSPGPQRWAVPFGDPSSSLPSKSELVKTKVPSNTINASVVVRGLVKNDPGDNVELLTSVEPTSNNVLVDNVGWVSYNGFATQTGPPTWYCDDTNSW